MRTTNPSLAHLMALADDAFADIDDAADEVDALLDDCFCRLDDGMSLSESVVERVTPLTANACCLVCTSSLFLLSLISTTRRYSFICCPLVTSTNDPTCNDCACNFK